MTGMTDTRDKFLEAKYFLDQMKSTQPDRDAFRYNLSAFLSAGRSVTWIMQNEFRHVSGFDDWYADKQTQMEKDELMKVLKNRRNLTVHQKSLRPHALVKVNLYERITVSESVSISIKHADGTEERRDFPSEPKPPIPAVPTTTEWLWYFDELPNVDIVTVCTEYVGKLESLVNECVSRFDR